MAAVVYRTELIEDPELIARLDAAVARHAPKWMRLSGPKMAERIDMWVARFDPATVRSTDAAAVDRALDALADTVCRNDSRTKAQRRADAFAAMAAGLTVLRC